MIPLEKDAMRDRFRSRRDLASGGGRGEEGDHGSPGRVGRRRSATIGNRHGGKLGVSGPAAIVLDELGLLVQVSDLSQRLQHAGLATKCVPHEKVQ